MVTVTILPAGPAPAQKTAVYKPKNLQEQLEAFLNSNNPSGFKKEAVAEKEIKPLPPLEYNENSRKIVDILLEVSNRYLLSEKRFKTYAQELKKCSGRRKGSCSKMSGALSQHGADRFGIPLNKARDIIAKILGYCSYHDAMNNQVNFVNGEKTEIFVILNKRLSGEFKEEFFPTIEEE